MKLNHKYYQKIFTVILLAFGFAGFADTIPDQYYSIYGADTLLMYIESSENIVVSQDNKSLMLEENALEGYFIMEPVSIEYDFNRGLPSWNGRATPGQASAFKVQIRFLINDSWSGWVTVGFWDKHIWSTYGSTTFNGGLVDIDYVKLNNYTNTFQYKVIFKRNTLALQSPTFWRLSFTASDSEYPIDINAIVEDNPEEFFIPTDFLCQYDIDDEIGGSICSPTTVSMIINSFDIFVDPLRFAQRNRDPYWGIYGVWPRVVTHASEYGLEGAVTRYRTWSEAADILQNGGRIAMSVGPPLYTGHLIMLAGFTENGNPIVHDPARSNGYSYIYNKQSLSESWFDKGGISYTYYLEDSTAVNSRELLPEQNDFTIYPNPVQESVYFTFNLNQTQEIQISVFDMNGRLIDSPLNESMVKGIHTFKWCAGSLKPGLYLVAFKTNKFLVNKQMIKID